MLAADFTYKPLTVHSPFHRSTSYERFLFGAFGSGKTYAAVAEGIAWMLEQPGIRGLFARKTVPELRDTLEPIFMELCPEDLLKASQIRRTGGHIESITFPNGSVALFRSLDDWNKHRSLNIGFMVIDEANEIDDETYQGMLSRIRQRDLTETARSYGYKGEITRRGVWCATNPAGHDWLYKRAVDPDHRVPSAEYFKSTSFDNPFLPPEYLDSLLAFPEPWVRRYVLCSFDDFAGQIYEDWGWDTHVVKPLPEYPSGSVFWMGFDPGTRSGNAGLWVYVDQAARCLIGVAEYQESGLSASRHAESWRKIEAAHKMNVAWRVADPNSINVRDRGSNMQLSDQYRRLGYNFALGPSREKDRIPMLGQLIALKRFKLTTNCPQTYEQLRDYRWEDITPAQRAKGVEPAEKALKKNVDLVDCAQYLSSRWVGAPRLAIPKPDESFSDEVHRILRKQRADWGTVTHEHELGGIAL